MCGVCSKLKIKTTERRQCRRSIVDFEHGNASWETATFISYLASVWPTLGHC